MKIPNDRNGAEMKHAKMKNYLSEQTNSNNSEFRYHVNLRYFRYMYLVDDQSLL